MNKPDSNQWPRFSDAEILSLRGRKNRVASNRPYAFHLEQERNAQGEVIDVATLFLTNRECPFRCLMCDLWKNTLDYSVTSGEIPTQIELALSRLAGFQSAREIKLYNSGNFFDRKAIPVQDYPGIAKLVSRFDRVIVENHPSLCTEDCLRFRDMIAPAELEIALGLETCHPELLQTLNKNMNLSDFSRACDFLHGQNIHIRAFILLKPPFLEESEGIEWAIRSLNYAFDRQVECCSMIPTRGGNGIMEQLERQGDFSPPSGNSLETVLERGLSQKKGRVFMDLWDAEQFFPCDRCQKARVERLHQMNLSQSILPKIVCGACCE